MKNFKTIYILLLISIVSNAFANIDDNCLKRGKIRYWQESKKVEQERAYCFDAKEFSVEAMACQDKNCMAREYKSVDQSTLQSEYGSPGFKLCTRHYLASPKIVEIWDGKKWFETSICEFDDKSFVDLGTLSMRSH